jgi:hypothetical protein
LSNESCISENGLRHTRNEQNFSAEIDHTVQHLVFGHGNKLGVGLRSLLLDDFVFGQRDDQLRTCELFLKDRWQLMGALKALNGTLLFGLTTAFTFAMIREVWDIERKERRHGQRVQRKHHQTLRAQEPSDPCEPR